MFIYRLRTQLNCMWLQWNCCLGLIDSRCTYVKIIISLQFAIFILDKAQLHHEILQDTFKQANTYNYCVATRIKCMQSQPYNSVGCISHLPSVIILQLAFKKIRTDYNKIWAFRRKFINVTSEERTQITRKNFQSQSRLLHDVQQINFRIIIAE